MQFKNYNVYFFFLVLASISVLTYFVIKPFLVSFLIAAILAHLFAPLYNFFLKRLKKKGASSFLTCLLIALLIVVPVLVVLSLVVDEIQVTLDNFSLDPDGVQKMIITLGQNLKAVPLLEHFDLEKNVNQESIMLGVKSLSQNTLSILQSTYNGVAHFVFVTFVMFFSLFYLFIDGKSFVKKMMQLSPLRDKYEKVLIEKFNSITRATIKGTTIIALIQGFLGGILFAFTGVPSPVLLGILMTVASVVPSIGSGLVWLPVGILMLVFGYFTQGLIILLIGGLVISMIDNFIRPKLVGRDTQMHPLMILFSTLGGIALFGISGFIVGPIIMSLFVAFWDIYALEFKAQLKEYN
ncbi:MAG: AI-2E family transporter [Parcubacteria group bacterium]|jgi:predicted PurR-regulated permease PerM